MHFALQSFKNAGDQPLKVKITETIDDKISPMRKRKSGIQI